VRRLFDLGLPEAAENLARAGMAFGKPLSAAVADSVEGDVLGIGLLEIVLDVLFGLLVVLGE